VTPTPLCGDCHERHRRQFIEAKHAVPSVRNAHLNQCTPDPPEGTVTQLQAPPEPLPTAAAHERRRWISDWHPEDETFWQSAGRRIAWRNLAFSIFVEHLGFLVWSLWSIVVVSLPAAGFTFDPGSLFLLVAVPPFVGSILRIPYTLAVPKFGGRNWTIVSGLLLLIPTGLLAYAVSEPSTPYWVFMLAAAFAGFGGGNFSSSMANISFFYPEKHKGFALGLNAAGGNMGVAIAQLLVPLVIIVGVPAAAV